MSPTAAPVRFDHLAELTDELGLFEHAEFAVPRRDHGYCVDDAGRALVVAYREPDPPAQLLRIGARCLAFVEAAVRPDGRMHNRRDTAGRWTDRPGTGDWWGRALWGLGVAAVHAPTADLRGRARAAFVAAARARSADLHALAYAALGAAELLTADAGNPSTDLLSAGVDRPARGDAAGAQSTDASRHCARALLVDVVAAYGPAPADPRWPWPQPRMTYGAGTLADGLLAAGQALGDLDTVRRGLEMLDFALVRQTLRGRLSVVPVSGRGPGPLRTRYDQQPIEVNALAEGCARAHSLTGDGRWREAVTMAWRWFTGDNDAGVAMIDAATGPASTG